MGDLSSVFHIFSVIVLAGLAFVVLRQGFLLRLWRDWNSARAEDRVTVGEPLRVLRQFAAAIGADFESEISLAALPPARLALTGCFDLQRQAGIRRIEITKAEIVHVNFILLRETGTMSVDLEKLRRELGGSIGVSLKTN